MPRSSPRRVRAGWYRDAGIADALDGRFAVLTCLLALADIRLERGRRRRPGAGPAAGGILHHQHGRPDARRPGFGDPSLGKQVRQMVGGTSGPRRAAGGLAVEAVGAVGSGWRGPASTSDSVAATRQRRRAGIEIEPAFGGESGCSAAFRRGDHGGPHRMSQDFAHRLPARPHSRRRAASIWSADEAECCAIARAARPCGDRPARGPCGAGPRRASEVRAAGRHQIGANPILLRQRRAGAGPGSTSHSNCGSCPSRAAGAGRGARARRARSWDVVFHNERGSNWAPAIADTLALALDPYPRGPQCRCGASGRRRAQRRAGRPLRGAGQVETKPAESKELEEGRDKGERPGFIVFDALCVLLFCQRRSWCFAMTKKDRQFRLASMQDEKVPTC